MAVVFAVTGCHKDTDTPIDKPADDKRVDEVVILFENDVHGAIDGYPIFAGYRDAVTDMFKYVVTVSCGDCISGNLTALYQGQSVIDIMKSVVRQSHRLKFFSPIAFRVCTKQMVFEVILFFCFFVD